ncbi:MAG: Xaa-Pro peptidase family protein [Candidatus Korobacteraceae bacterium]|jgi:Xaa-Pro aminopeptidase
MDFRGRQKNLSELLERHKVDALLVTHLPNVYYLCGFTGTAGMLLAARRPVFFTDGRYSAQAAAQLQGARLSIARGGTLAAVAATCVKLGLKRVAIESERLTVAQLDVFSKALGKSVKVIRLAGAVEQLRAVKDAEEIELLRAAVELSSKLFRPLLRTLRAGTAELAVAARLEYMARRAGADGMSFNSIIASAQRSALPHGVATAAKLPSTGFVVLDYGVVIKGYCSDMTRTIHLGKAPVEARAIYDAVLEAQLAAISMVRPGVTAGEIDRAARQQLKRAKLDRFFTHSTGHGVGLEIHELPRLSAGNDANLKAGMVITVEPGVYLPGKCGVRIEDMLLVTGRGYEVLTPVSKKLIELY